MTGPLLRSLIIPCFLAACASSGHSPAADGATSTRDAADSTAAARDCISSANRLCTVGDAAVPEPDAAAAKTDSASLPLGPDVASPDLPEAGADATGPDAVDARPDTTTDATSRKEDTAVDDAVLPDATFSKADTSLADGPRPGPDVLAPDSKGDATCAQESFVHLSPSELKALLDGGEDPILINVKGSSIKNIPGTDAVLANDVPGIEALVKNDLCANIVIYCRSGGISQTVGSQLVAKGYRRVRDLAGGIIAWEAAGYPSE